MDYRATLREQLRNAQIPGKRTYYEYLYSIISSKLQARHNVLEVGSGAGVSRLFLKDVEIIRTDYLDWSDENVRGNIDAQNLPFANDEFSCVFGVDMLHHVPEPIKVVSEAIRVVSNSGTVVFVEPYVSGFSYLFYKLFHPEDTTLGLKVVSGVPIKFDSESSGDQIIAQRVFLDFNNLASLRQACNKNFELEILYLSPFSFFATGGLNSPFGLSPAGIRALIRAESLLGTRVLKILSARAIYILKVTN
jgi:SAM-dependent methyltransferase